jgi:hypothetical protein
VDVNVNDLIVISVGTMVVTTIVRHVKEKPKDIGKGYAKPIVFGFLLAIVLMILALPFPRFTKGLAILGMIGAFAVNGPTIYKLLGA